MLCQDNLGMQNPPTSGHAEANWPHLLASAPVSRVILVTPVMGQCHPRGIRQAESPLSISVSRSLCLQCLVGLLTKKADGPEACFNMAWNWDKSHVVVMYSTVAYRNSSYLISMFTCVRLGMKSLLSLFFLALIFLGHPLSLFLFLAVLSIFLLFTMELFTSVTRCYPKKSHLHFSRCSLAVLGESFFMLVIDDKDMVILTILSSVYIYICKGCDEY